MDKRKQRRISSKVKIEAAIERLRSGNATHPLHIGIQVRLTKQAVAREARVSSATLYRFPELITTIDESFQSTQRQKMPKSEQRRRNLLARIEELERQNNQLLAENLRLTQELAASRSRASKPGLERFDERRVRRAGS